MDCCCCCSHCCSLTESGATSCYLLKYEQEQGHKHESLHLCHKSQAFVKFFLEIFIRIVWDSKSGVLPAHFVSVWHCCCGLCSSMKSIPSLAPECLCCIKHNAAAEHKPLSYTASA